jgi:hypothetical protein
MGLGSGIRKKPIPDPGSRIPDPGVKKAPDPGSGSATLLDRKIADRQPQKAGGQSYRKDVGKELFTNLVGKELIVNLVG